MKNGIVGYPLTVDLSIEEGITLRQMAAVMGIAENDLVGQIIEDYIAQNGKRVLAKFIAEYLDA